MDCYYSMFEIRPVGDYSTLPACDEGPIAEWISRAETPWWYGLNQVLELRHHG